MRRKLKMRKVKMEQAYKGYTIRSGAAPIRDSVGYKPIAQINWTENGQERVKLWMEWCFTARFATHKEAEREAQTFAEDWIDDNTKVKPETKKQ
jgi:hypothetical protein